MKKANKVIKFLLILVIFAVITNIYTFTKAEYRADKEWKAVKPGDTIYFDTTGLDNWDNVYIYLWKNGSGDCIDAWPGAQMVKVDGTRNIYEFTVPSNIELNKYNMVIFNNGQGGNENQTIDLGFIEHGFVYKVDSWQSGKRIGYWYLYDKSSIVSHLEDVKKYQVDKQYYTEASYGDLDHLIAKAATELNGEIRLETERDNQGNGTGKYYINIDIIMDTINSIVNNLKVNKDVLNQKVSSEENNINEYEKKYTPDSIENLNNKIDEARDLLTKDNITVDEMKKILNDIDQAINTLIEKADKTRLEELLNKITDLDKSIYTDESVQSLDEITKPSEEIFYNENATQEDVDNIVDKLEQSIEALEKKPSTNNGNENNNNNDNGNNQNNNNNNDSNNENNNYNKKEDENKKQNQVSKEMGLTPKTGDMSIIIYGILLLLAIVIYIATVIYNKRKSKQK